MGIIALTCAYGGGVGGVFLGMRTADDLRLEFAGSTACICGGAVVGGMTGLGIAPIVETLLDGESEDDDPKNTNS